MPEIEEITPDLIGDAKIKRVQIFTDGSCLNNPGTGGYCAILKYPNRKQKVVLGAESDTTSNRMELRAVLEGLKALPKGRYRVISAIDLPPSQG